MTARTSQQQCHEVKERVEQILTREKALDCQKEKFIVEQIRWKQQVDVALIRAESEKVCTIHLHLNFVLARMVVS